MQKIFVASACIAALVAGNDDVIELPACDTPHQNIVVVEPSSFDFADRVVGVQLVHKGGSMADGPGPAQRFAQAPGALVHGLKAGLRGGNAATSPLNTIIGTGNLLGTGNSLLGAKEGLVAGIENGLSAVYGMLTQGRADPSPGLATATVPSTAYILQPVATTTTVYTSPPAPMTGDFPNVAACIHTKPMAEVAVEIDSSVEEKKPIAPISVTTAEVESSNIPESVAEKWEYSFSVDSPTGEQYTFLTSNDGRTAYVKN